MQNVKRHLLDGTGSINAELCTGCLSKIMKKDKKIVVEEEDDDDEGNEQEGEEKKKKKKEEEEEEDFNFKFCICFKCSKNNEKEARGWRR